MTRLFAGTPWDRPPTCERCGKLESECACPPPAVEPKRLPPEEPDGQAGPGETGQGQDRHRHRLARSRRQRPARAGGPAQGLMRYRRDDQGRTHRASGQPCPGGRRRTPGAGIQDQAKVDTLYSSTEDPREPVHDDPTRDAGDARGAGDPGDRLPLLQRVPGGPGRRARRSAGHPGAPVSATARTSTRPTAGCSSATISRRSPGPAR